MSRRTHDRVVETVMLLLLIVAVAAIGAAGSAITLPQIDGWYASEVVKPSFTPPNWVFGPVWTALYVLMALAAWLVWRETGLRNARRPLAFWSAQLVLNLGWSYLFFGLNRIGWSIVEIAILFAAIVLTMREFNRYRPLAAWLLVPYLAWVAYAGVLNFAIWRLNQ